MDNTTQITVTLTTRDLGVINDALAIHVSVAIMHSDKQTMDKIRAVYERLNSQLSEAPQC